MIFTHSYLGARKRGYRRSNQRLMLISALVNQGLVNTSARFNDESVLIICRLFGIGLEIHFITRYILPLRCWLFFNQRGMALVLPHM